MSRRDRLTDPFSRGGDDEPSRPSLRDVDAELFGDLSRQDIGRVEVRPVSIFDIMPDETQPRRVVPLVVRKQWDGKLDNLAQLFEVWLQMAAEESGREISLDAYLTLHEEVWPETGEPGGPIEVSLMEILRLAASIRQEGLTNPITVVRSGRRFRLETGERRWFAYHLLRLWAQNVEGENPAQWERIPARVMDEFSVWRQAFENNARTDLGAIAKARQLALLLMDLHRDKPFARREQFEHERDFYAQVADGQAFSIRGNAEQIVSAMGVNNRSVITRYRNLLKLPYLVWEVADDLNWPERKLRPLTGLKDKDALALAAKWAAQEGYSLPMGNVLVESDRPDPVDKLVSTLERSKRQLERHITKIDRKRAIELVRAYKEWIEALEEQLSEKQ